MITGAVSGQVERADVLQARVAQQVEHQLVGVEERPAAARGYPGEETDGIRPAARGRPSGQASARRRRARRRVFRDTGERTSPRPGDCDAHAGNGHGIGRRPLASADGPGRRPALGARLGGDVRRPPAGSARGRRGRAGRRGQGAVLRRAADVLERTGSRSSAGSCRSCRRRPSDEAAHPGLGSSAEVALILPGEEQDRAFLLYELSTAGVQEPRSACASRSRVPTDRLRRSPSRAGGTARRRR